MQCPKCQSLSVHRSRSRNPWERWRKEITGKRPYRCADCGWRGWAPDQEPSFSDEERSAAERTVTPDPPNLAGTPVARADTPPRAVDPDALDAHGPTMQD